LGGADFDRGNRYLFSNFVSQFYKLFFSMFLKLCTGNIFFTVLKSSAVFIYNFVNTIILVFAFSKISHKARITHNIFAHNIEINRHFDKNIFTLGFIKHTCPKINIFKNSFLSQYCVHFFCKLYKNIIFLFYYSLGFIPPTAKVR